MYSNTGSPPIRPAPPNLMPRVPLTHEKSLFCVRLWLPFQKNVASLLCTCTCVFFGVGASGAAAVTAPPGFSCALLSSAYREARTRARPPARPDALFSLCLMAFEVMMTYGMQLTVISRHPLFFLACLWLVSCSCRP